MTPTKTGRAEMGEMKAARKKKSEPATPAPTVTAYKGFDHDWKCRDFQYEVGKTYEHNGAVEACASGFHACENPWDVLNYYPIHDSKFAVVTMGGTLARHPEDSKIASAKITIDAELRLPDFIRRCIDWMIGHTKDKGDDSSGYSAQIGSSGDSARIGSSGNYARIGSSGDYARIGSSGNYARIGSSGDYAQIGSSGDSAQIGSSGDYAQIGSSGYSAQIGSSGNSAQIGSSGNSAQIGSSGDYARIGSSGYYARIGSSGDYAQIGSSGYSAQIAATGTDAVVAAAGSVSSFSLGAGGCAAVPYHDGKRTRFALAYEGENVKTGVAYRVNERGEFEEVA